MTSTTRTAPWPAPDPATRHRETFNRGLFRWVTLPDPTEAITYAPEDAIGAEDA